MINEKNEVVCNYPRDCGKPATRVLSYYVDAPTALSLDHKSEAFCDKHAEAEMRTLQKPGLFFFGSGAKRVDGIVRELSNDSIEDCCSHHVNEDRTVIVRVGKNVDPTLWGYAPERRGTTFVLYPTTAAWKGCKRPRVWNALRTK